MFQIDHRQFSYDTSGELTQLQAFTAYLASVDTTVADCGLFGNVSPHHKITLDNPSKKAAYIPQSAQYFAWIYPSVLFLYFV